MNRLHYAFASIGLGIGIIIVNTFENLYRYRYFQYKKLSLSSSLLTKQFQSIVNMSALHHQRPALVSVNIQPDKGPSNSFLTFSLFDQRLYVRVPSTDGRISSRHNRRLRRGVAQAAAPRRSQRRVGAAKGAGEASPFGWLRRHRYKNGPWAYSTAKSRH